MCLSWPGYRKVQESLRLRRIFILLFIYLNLTQGYCMFQIFQMLFTNKIDCIHWAVIVIQWNMMFLLKGIIPWESRIGPCLWSTNAKKFPLEIPPPYLQRYFPFLRQFTWKHSQHSQHSRTMGPVQTGQALPVSAHILILVTHRLQPSPPQFHILKLGGLLSNFKAHFDRIRNW